MVRDPGDLRALHEALAKKLISEGDWPLINTIMQRKGCSVEEAIEMFANAKTIVPRETLLDYAGAQTLGADRIVSDESAALPKQGSETKTIAPHSEEKHPTKRPGHENVIKGEIARGGMGIVYRAYQTDLGREVALKVTQTTDPHFIARFQREIDITAALKGNGVVAIHRAGQLPDPTVKLLEKANIRDGTPYYTMDIVEGLELEEIITESILNRKEMLRKIFIPACEYVHNMHEKGIVHRDLKPANIMLQNDERVVIMDLGLAKKIGQADLKGDKTTNADAKLTADGQTPGTPAYMAPEQFKEEEADAATDVYQLGAILYEMLTGLTHRGGLGVGEIAARAAREDLHDKYKAPEKLDPTIDGALASIVKKALKFEREDRYPTAKELAKDVNRWLEGEDVKAHNYGKWEKIARKIQRHPGAVAGGLSAMLLGIIAAVGGAGYFAQKQHAERQARIAATEEVKRKEAEAESAKAKAEKADFFEKRMRANNERFKGKERLDRGVDLEAAIEHYLKCIKIDPTYVDCYFELGQIHYMLIHPDKAVEYFEEANEISQKTNHKNDSRALIYAGFTCVDLMDDLKKGTEYFKRVIEETTSDEPHMQIAKSLINFFEGKLDKAVVSAENVQQKGFWEGSYLLAGYHSKNVPSLFDVQKPEKYQDNKKALEFINTALRQKPNHPRCLYFRAQLHAEMEDLKNALEDINLLLQLYPSVAEFHNKRGICQYKLGNSESGLKDLETAASLLRNVGRNPTEENCGYRGLIYSTNKQWEEAEKCFSEGITLDKHQKNLPFHHTQRARVRLQLRNPSAALDDIMKALDIDSEYHMAWAQLGVYHEVSNEPEKAMEAYKKAINLKARKIGEWYAQGSQLTSLQALRAYINISDKKSAEQIMRQSK